jgi:putative PIN family toxin of toxin-antitoxin system
MLSERTVRATLRLIVLRSELIEPDVEITVCRDPHDDKFLEVAVTGKADVIVSRDNDLLTMGSYAGIQIVPPGQFLMMLDKPKI